MSWLRRPGKCASRENDRLRDRRRRCAVEALEDRRMLAVLTVETTADLLDSNDGVTSLREAIIAANMGAGEDTIVFDPAVFTGAEQSLIRLTQGELEITDTLTIDGTGGVDVTITGDADGDDITDAANNTIVSASFGGVAGAQDDLLDDNSRVISFLSAAGDLTIEGIAITGGQVMGQEALGGGINFASSETLTISASSVTGNAVIGATAQGGGVFTSSGSVTLVNSSVSGNLATGKGYGTGYGDYAYGWRHLLSDRRCNGNERHSHR